MVLPLAGGSQLQILQQNELNFALQKPDTIVRQAPGKP